MIVIIDNDYNDCERMMIVMIIMIVCERMRDDKTTDIYLLSCCLLGGKLLRCVVLAVAVAPINDRVCSVQSAVARDIDNSCSALSCHQVHHQHHFTTHCQGP